MENASKALLISGGMLIAILLLTLFSYLFTRMGEQTEAIYNQMESSDIRKFNQNFLQYDVKSKEKITIQDVVTLVNLAIHSNREQKYTDKIKVLVEGCGCEKQVGNKFEDWANIYDDEDKGINEILEDHIEDVKNGTIFECDVSINTKTSVVDVITIRKK